MHNDENIQVAFHNKATAAVFSFYQAFQREVSEMSRRTNEYHFQQLKKKYVSSLELELQNIAQDILTRHTDAQSRTNSQPLHQFIKDYLHRFVQKINDL